MILNKFRCLVGATSPPYCREVFFPSPHPSIHPSDTIHACIFEGIRYIFDEQIEEKYFVSSSLKKSYFEIEAFSLEEGGRVEGKDVLNKFVSMKIHFFFPSSSFFVSLSFLSLSLLLLKCNYSLLLPFPFPALRVIVL